MKKILAIGLMAVVPAAWAQRPAANERQVVEVDLQAGAMRYKASGPGECKHAPRAGIYGVQAAMYRVSHRTGERSVRVTLWQPASGAAMLNLDVAEGSKRVSIDTVKGGAKKDTRGSAEVTVARKGRAPPSRWKVWPPAGRRCAAPCAARLSEASRPRAADRAEGGCRTIK